MKSKKLQQQHASAIRILVAIGDFFLLNLAFFAVIYIFRTHYFGLLNYAELKYRIVLVNMSYAISLFSTGIILDRRIVFSENIVALVFRTTIIFAGILFAASSILSSTFIFTNWYWILYVVAVFICISCWRILSRSMLKSYRIHGGNHRQLIILGAGSVAQKVYNATVKNLEYGYRFIGFFDDRAKEDYKVDPSLVKGSLADVEKFAEEYGADEIICALPAGDDRKALPILRFAENNLIRFYIVPDFMRFIRKSVSLTTLADSIPIISLREEPLKAGMNRFLKRSFDIVFSLAFTVFVFPILFIVLGTIIKATSKGPIFFLQKRTGKEGKEFTCIKFRTMTVNKDADEKQATKGDARITKIGAFMRKTNLDEMPQFLNVLVGDMSIVGPRPHMLKHTEIYSHLIDKYMVRHFAKPGITGWAQVTGFRGETKDLSEMEGRIKQDVWYIENWTFWLDLKIIFKTVANMIKGEEKAY
ncbi:MAG: undecaprenyl-phosphate glucose phosphotransferase [Paludibacteraceae bacterium]|nr:undecaprenyl-phosphate glucose phosphotransferase [Paludibacteraceae bacterium]MBP5480746.1 undecaprenyl-phosphate glucose phosphotransferase [Paludibacteraceae bacterium]